MGEGELEGHVLAYQMLGIIHALGEKGGVHFTVSLHWSGSRHFHFISESV